MIPTDKVTSINYQSHPFHTTLDDIVVQVEPNRVDLALRHTREPALLTIPRGRLEDYR